MTPALAHFGGINQMVTGLRIGCAGREEGAAKGRVRFRYNTRAPEFVFQSPVASQGGRAGLIVKRGG